MVVGVTGGIGSGKSLVSSYFLALNNVVYYHADEEAKKLMISSLDIKRQLIGVFGDETYVKGELNKEFISNQVFKNNEKLRQLNAIVHPAVQQHFINFIEGHSNQLIIYENAILFEIGSDQYCDVVIHVSASLEERILRVMTRDNTTRDAVENRIKNQWSDEKKGLLANYIICNSDKTITKQKVKKIYNILTENR